MYRSALENLLQWKANPNRRPLILRGAWGTGKTWLLKEFARIAYSDSVYIDFSSDRKMAEYFCMDHSAERVISCLEIFCGHKIHPDSVLILFDEIQDSPGVLESLKDFCRNAPQYQILAASSYPVAYPADETPFTKSEAEVLRLYPLSFIEFLLALKKDRFVNMIQNRRFELIQEARQPLMDLAKMYCIIGGVPEIVSEFARSRDFSGIRALQMDFFRRSVREFSKHVPENVKERASMISLAAKDQFLNGQKKFIYNRIKKGAHAADYLDTIDYLCECGYSSRISRTASPKDMLVQPDSRDNYKLYYTDIGLFSCMIGIDPIILLDGNAIFTLHHGMLAEYFTAQQLMTIQNLQLAYYTNERNACMVQFLLGSGKKVYPAEVMVTPNLRSKAMKTYREKFHPEKAFRISLENYHSEDGLTTLPLYAISRNVLCKP